MAVLIEGISVVVRCSSIARLYERGPRAFAADIPNNSLCADGELARIGFMSPADARAYVEQLERRNLKYLVNRAAVDLVVVDQRTGPVVACDWVEFGTTHWNNDPKCPIAVCRAKGTRAASVVVPNGWTFEKSMSARHTFVDRDEMQRSFEFVRSEPNIDVYRHRITGEEFYVSRSNSN